MKKILLGVVLCMAVAGYYKWSQDKIDNLSAQITLSKLSTDSTTRLNDSLSAVIASARVDKDELEAALEAAEELNAELVAAARIRIQPDTVRDTVTVPTVATEDGTRVAEVSDTTESGTLNLRITAPPFPAELTIAYEYIPAPIEPVVSLLRVADGSAIFAVTYRGGSQEIVAPFARLPDKERRLVGYARAGYEFSLSSWMGAVGGTLKAFWGIYGYGELQHIVKTGVTDSPTRVSLGVEYRF